MTSNVRDRVRPGWARKPDRAASADARDDVGSQRDAQVIDRIPIAADPEMTLTMQLEALIAQATADRVQAANDRAKAARLRARLEVELEHAHLDELTGAYRRGSGRMALAHETNRARRSGGGFVLAFVDVDRLKEVNDQHGHAAGDQVLQAVVRIIRENLRSFDPVVRYGGDEFICGLSGASLTEARRRFGVIAAGVAAETEVGISVGLAKLKATDTVEHLTRRADVAMLRVKARHHARDPVPVMAHVTSAHPRQTGSVRA